MADFSSVKVTGRPINVFQIKLLYKVLFMVSVLLGFWQYLLWTTNMHDLWNLHAYYSGNKIPTSIICTYIIDRLWSRKKWQMAMEHLATVEPIYSSTSIIIYLSVCVSTVHLQYRIITPHLCIWMHHKLC